MAASRNGRVQSVTRALQLLEALTADEEMGLMELAKRTDLLPSTVHRLLATLADRGYIYQNRETGKYLLSFRVLEVASHVAHRTDRLRAAARPFLERICRVCRETTNLVLLDQWNIVYVDQVLGERAVRLFAEVGRNIPAHTTGAGKAMLAFSAADDLQALLEHEPFESFTPNTITTAKGLSGAEADTPSRLRDGQRGVRGGVYLRGSAHLRPWPVGVRRNQRVGTLGPRPSLGQCSPR
jgi:DNA-binding IclR family transcriptional regulator